MRALLAAAACLLAGCTAPPPPESSAPALDVLGDVRVVEATLLPASFGGGRPAAPLRVLADGVETRVDEGEGVSLELDAGGARLRLVNHEAWIRTSLRVEDSACAVTLRTPTSETTLPPKNIPLDHAIGPDSPYHDYRFDGTCEGRLFLLWRG